MLALMCQFMPEFKILMKFIKTYDPEKFLVKIQQDGL